jgi:hypothetical protein
MKKTHTKRHLRVFRRFQRAPRPPPPSPPLQRAVSASQPQPLFKSANNVCKEVSIMLEEKTNKSRSHRLDYAQRVSSPSQPLYENPQ